MSKQTSDFNITCLKWTSPEGLMTCGNENIRFWRQKAAHLVGQAVVLNNHARNNRFISLAVSEGKAYVGSNQGMLYIVDTDSRQLENVYKLHDSAITAVRIGIKADSTGTQRFCATGSQDSYLRVWPLDFSEFQLEAKHEQQVSDIAIKPDGQKVLCGNDSNGLGVVDLNSQSYRTILRSHAA